MVNSKFNRQQLKVFLLVQGLFALFLTTTDKAFAAGTINIKDTNYAIPSNAYFVAPDGKDSNSGKSPNSPWTVAKAMKTATSGSTIVFRGGTYRDINSIGIGRKLTLQPYPYEKVWIKGSLVVTGWVADGNIWRKDGWTYSFPPPSYMDSNYVDPKYPMSVQGDMVYINGVAMQQVASKAEVKPGTFFVDTAHDRLYIGDNPTGKTVESTAKTQAFGIWASKNIYYNPSQTIIRGLGFAHYAQTALSVTAARVKLENNAFVWNGIVGVKFSGKDGIVRGNTFSYNGDQGLVGNGADRMLLEYNTFSYNNVERFAKDWDAAGVKAAGADGMVWRNNLVEHNFSTGMWFDGSATNASIVNNVVRYNDDMGIFFEISHNGIIAANLVYNNDVGIMSSNSTKVRVYNNTLANNGSNIQIKDSKRNNPNEDEAASGITWIARDTVVKNNILSNTTGNAFFQASNCDTREAASLMIDNLDYNGYYRKSSSTPKYQFKWSLGGSKCAVSYASIADFRSATGNEKNALIVENSATNPFFEDEAKGDFSLRLGSPALKRGQALPADIAKAIGWKSGVAVDLGAIQSP